MEARCRSFSTLSAAAVALGALLVSLSPGGAQADPAAAYQIQPLVKSGDQVGDFTIGSAKANGLWVIGLNDPGQVLCDAFSNATQIGLLAEYRHGALVPVALPGQDGPVGKWPRQISPIVPMNMNQR